MFESIRLKDIPRKSRCLVRRPSGTRPALWLIEENDTQAVVKDFSSNGFLFRNSIGRFLIRRERRAYTRLQGLKGIPVLYGSLEGLALILENIPGRDMESLDPAVKLSEDFFRELRSLVESFHARGLAHCDLKRAPNIILGPDGNPSIVDWAASISRKTLFPGNRLYARFIRDDLDAITKLRIKYRPECVSPEEKRQYAHRTRAEKIIRSIRDSARNLLQKIV